MSTTLPGAGTSTQGAPFYITTAIAYPNGDPHVGHAYEYIAITGLDPATVPLGSAAGGGGAAGVGFGVMRAMRVSPGLLEVRLVLRRSGSGSYDARIQI